MMGTLLLFIGVGVGFSSSAITLLYLAVLCSGAQNVIVNRNVRRSDYSNKYKGSMTVVYYKILIVVEGVLDLFYI